MKQVLLIIPTYNEAANIRPLVKAIKSVFEKQSGYLADILFVDDTSPDGTGTIIRKLQAKDSHIHLLSGTKAGLGKAYIRGFQHGLKLKQYDAFVTMDADLSHDPRDISRLLVELDGGVDYVIGSRYIAGGKTENGYALRRRLQSRLANGFARQFIDLKLETKDLTGGFKAIRRSKLATIPLENIVASGYVFQVNLLYEFAKRGYIIREIPIMFHARARGSSKLGIRDMLEFVRLTYQLNPRSRLRRMIRFVSVGAIGSVVNLAVLVSLVEIVGLEVTAAYFIALESSIIGNFFLNHHFTFRFARSNSVLSRMATTLDQIGKLLRYNLVALAGAGISATVFLLCFKELHLPYVLADIVGIVAATCWNYWLSVRVVWRIVDNPPAEKSKTARYESQEA